MDLTTLEKCSGSYVSDDLRDRADDLIWRVHWGQDWLYVYLLLEFQSACQARHRFGPAVAAQAEPLLTAIADPLQLADLGDALLSCTDGTAWLHVLHQARSASTTGDEHP